MNAETKLMGEIHRRLSELDGVALWRNNCGVAEHWKPGAARPDVVRYGLAVGSADLVGVVGGRFVALEVKTPAGRVTEEQTQWLALVERCGGVGRVVRSVDEALGVVREVLGG